MRFSKWVFASAGVWGVLVVTPLFLALDTIGRRFPPAITHREFYYGFAGVTLAWQLVFFVIASDPVRFRPLMPVAVFEKIVWLATLVVLYAQNRIGSSAGPFGAADLVFGALFVLAYFNTPAS
jgi:hypothetical protein